MGQDFIETRTDLLIEGDYNNTLDIAGFSCMMNSPSYCYKFYWLEAIVQIVNDGILDTTFDAVVNEMICNAWYIVRQYHIHLSGIQLDGEVRDGLERAVLKLEELSNLPVEASRDQIKKAISEHDDELRKMKTQLIYTVPYYALSGFFPKGAPTINQAGIARMTAYIAAFSKNQTKLPYTFGESSSLSKEIHIHPLWANMIKDNTFSILGWIQYEKMRWLQDRNPEVPGLVYKLSPQGENKRKLEYVRKLWDSILDLQSIVDVFKNEPINPKAYDVDHFIPRSFVMSDELWNLMPMNPSLNSSKNNRLPQWNRYFKAFAKNQFTMYELIHDDSKPQIHKRYEACFKDNLHAIWGNQELYRKGNSEEEFTNILEKNMQPIYDSARRQGYQVW